MEFVRLSYGIFLGWDFKEKGPRYAENILKTLKPFEAFLGDHDWLAGANITWAGKQKSRFTVLCSSISVYHELHLNLFISHVISCHRRFYYVGDVGSTSPFQTLMPG